MAAFLLFIVVSDAASIGSSMISQDSIDPIELDLLLKCDKP